MIWLGGTLVLLGVLLNLVGTFGLFRFDDVYTRSHAASLTDTFAAFIIVSGLVLMSPAVIVALKLIMLLIFLVFSSPTATHALAQTALHDGVIPRQEK